MINKRSDNSYENKLFLVILGFLVTMLALLVFASVASAAPWSQAKTRKTVYQAARYYKIPESRIDNLADAAIDIVYTGVQESGGGKHVHTGQHRGMWQFNRCWNLPKHLRKRATKAAHNHGSCGWKCCRVCSTYRFVYVYKKGGYDALNTHWKATLGR